MADSGRDPDAGGRRPSARPSAGWARVAGHGVGHARLQGALARELGASADEVAASERLLDRLAARLRPAADGDAAEQLLAVGDVLAPALRRAPAVHRLGVDDLVLCRVLGDGTGHPLALAVAAAAACHRAGLALDVVGAGPTGLALAHRDLDEPYVLDPLRAWCFTATEDLGETRPRWLDAGGAALLVLDALADRGRELAQPWLALAAAELRVALPVDARTAQRLEVERRRERARLN